MKPPKKSSNLPEYKRAVVAMVLILLCFLSLSNFFLIKMQRDKHIRNIRTLTSSELEEAGAFMVEPLLHYDFENVELFIKKWIESQKDVIKFEAITPQRLILTSFKRSYSSPFQISTEKKVMHNGQELLTLRITKDYKGLESILQRTTRNLIISSFFIVIFLGISLWFIFKRLAIIPLENEIHKRMQVEKELEYLNQNLDEEVRKKTVELRDNNKILKKEISQRQKTENLLAAEKDRIAVTLRSIADGVISTDVNSNVVLINQVAEHLIGWNQKDVEGRQLMEFFQIIDIKIHKPIENPVENAIKIDQAVVRLDNNTALISKDERQYLIDYSCAPIKDRSHLTVGAVLVFRDITDQKRREQELIKLEKLESIGLLAGGIAHDFNNLLAAILGNINLAQLDSSIEERTKELLSKAEKAALRGKDLTMQLLTFAKGGTPIKEVSSIRQIIEESTNFVLHGDKISCDFDIPPNLWLTEIDKGQVSQVVQNIVINARHAMPYGGNIRVSCENVSLTENPGMHDLKEGDYIKISISDNGKGIQKDIIEKIFDPYFTTKKGGSGLGLSICQSIIRKHQGDIFVKSVTGKGSTFTIYLPASRKSNAEFIEQRRINRLNTKLKILIMDDERFILDMLKDMLRELGHEVLLSSDGEEAVNIYREHFNTPNPVDLVIMDLTVPGGLGGKEAIKKILGIDSKAKVVVSSGYSSDPIIANHKEYGFCGSLSKPFKFQELSEAIGRIFAD